MMRRKENKEMLDFSSKHRHSFFASLLSYFFVFLLPSFLVFLFFLRISSFSRLLIHHKEEWSKRNLLLTKSRQWNDSITIKKGFFLLSSLFHSRSLEEERERERDFKSTRVHANIQCRETSKNDKWVSKSSGRLEWTDDDDSWWEN